MAHWVIKPNNKFPFFLKGQKIKEK
jgi:hypothetical protein